MAEYAWSCLQCPAHGTGPKFDLDARKHEVPAADRCQREARAWQAVPRSMANFVGDAEYVLPPTEGDA